MAFHDIIFTATKNPTRQRVEGKLVFTDSGATFRALSGSRTLLPLPNGAYTVMNMKIRNKANMALPVKASENGGGGMCFPAWSIEVHPLFSSQRTLLRIHPDGNLPGTRGCIGIT